MGLYAFQCGCSSINCFVLSKILKGALLKNLSEGAIWSSLKTPGGLSRGGCIPSPPADKDCLHLMYSEPCEAEPSVYGICCRKASCRNQNQVFCQVGLHKRGICFGVVVHNSQKYTQYPHDYKVAFTLACSSTTLYVASSFTNKLHHSFLSRTTCCHPVFLRYEKKSFSKKGGNRICVRKRPDSFTRLNNSVYLG